MCSQTGLSLYVDPLCLSFGQGKSHQISDGTERCIRSWAKMQPFENVASEKKKLKRYFKLRVAFEWYCPCLETEEVVLQLGCKVELLSRTSGPPRLLRSPPFWYRPTAVRSRLSGNTLMQYQRSSSTKNPRKTPTWFRLSKMADKTWRPGCLAKECTLTCRGLT